MLSEYVRTIKRQRFRMGPIGSPETSVSKPLTSRNNPQDGRIQFNRGRSPKISLTLNSAQSFNTNTFSNSDLVQRH